MVLSTILSMKAKTSTQWGLKQVLSRERERERERETIIKMKNTHAQIQFTMHERNYRVYAWQGKK